MLKHFPSAFTASSLTTTTVISQHAHNPLPTSSLFYQLLATAVASDNHRRTHKECTIFVLHKYGNADFTARRLMDRYDSDEQRGEATFHPLFIAQHFRYTASPAAAFVTHSTYHEPRAYSGTDSLCKRAVCVNNREGLSGFCSFLLTYLMIPQA